VQCVFSDEAAAFEGTSVLVRAQLLEGKFPDFEAVIPKTWTTRFTAYTADLLRALKRAEVFSRDNDNSTRLEVLGAAGDATIQLRVTGRSGERGDSETDIAIAGEGDTLTAFFNVRYMLDLLAVVETERVVFESAGAASASVWREEGGDSFIQILMPMSGGRYS
jgi:DNA polymerase-3 subunit beta